MALTSSSSLSAHRCSLFPPSPAYKRAYAVGVWGDKDFWLCIDAVGYEAYNASILQKIQADQQQQQTQQLPTNQESPSAPSSLSASSSPSSSLPPFLIKPVSPQQQHLYSPLRLLWLYRVVDHTTTVVLGANNSNSSNSNSGGGGGHGKSKKSQTATASASSSLYAPYSEERERIDEANPHIVDVASVSPNQVAGLYWKSPLYVAALSAIAAAAARNSAGANGSIANVNTASSPRSPLVSSPTIAATTAAAAATAAVANAVRVVYDTFPLQPEVGASTYNYSLFHCKSKVSTEVSVASVFDFNVSMEFAFSRRPRLNHLTYLVKEREGRVEVFKKWAADKAIAEKEEKAKGGQKKNSPVSENAAFDANPIVTDPTTATDGGNSLEADATASDPELEAVNQLRGDCAYFYLAQSDLKLLDAKYRAAFQDVALLEEEAAKNSQREKEAAAKEKAAELAVAAAPRQVNSKQKATTTITAGAGERKKKSVAVVDVDDDEDDDDENGDDLPISEASDDSSEDYKDDDDDDTADSDNDHDLHVGHGGRNKKGSSGAKTNKKNPPATKKRGRPATKAPQRRNSYLNSSSSDEGDDHNDDGGSDLNDDAGDDGASSCDSFDDFDSDEDAVGPNPDGTEPPLLVNAFTTSSNRPSATSAAKSFSSPSPSSSSALLLGLLASGDQKAAAKLEKQREREQRRIALHREALLSLKSAQEEAKKARDAHVAELKAIEDRRREAARILNKVILPPPSLSSLNDNKEGEAHDDFTVAADAIASSSALPPRYVFVSAAADPSSKTTQGGHSHKKKKGSKRERLDEDEDSGGEGAGASAAAAVGERGSEIYRCGQQLLREAIRDGRQKRLAMADAATAKAEEGRGAAEEKEEDTVDPKETQWFLLWDSVNHKPVAGNARSFAVTTPKLSKNVIGGTAANAAAIVAEDDYVCEKAAKLICLPFLQPKATIIANPNLSMSREVTGTALVAADEPSRQQRLLNALVLDDDLSCQTPSSSSSFSSSQKKRQMCVVASVPAYPLTAVSSPSTPTLLAPPSAAPSPPPHFLLTSSVINAPSALDSNGMMVMSPFHRLFAARETLLAAVAVGDPATRGWYGGGWKQNVLEKTHNGDDELGIGTSRSEANDTAVGIKPKEVSKEVSVDSIFDFGCKGSSALAGVKKEEETYLNGAAVDETVIDFEFAPTTDAVKEALAALSSLANGEEAPEFGGKHKKKGSQRGGGGSLSTHQQQLVDAVSSLLEKADRTLDFICSEGVEKAADNKKEEVVRLAEVNANGKKRGRPAPAAASASSSSYHQHQHQPANSFDPFAEEASLPRSADLYNRVLAKHRKRLRSLVVVDGGGENEKADEEGGAKKEEEEGRSNTSEYAYVFDEDREALGLTVKTEAGHAAVGDDNAAAHNNAATAVISPSEEDLLSAHRDLLMCVLAATGKDSL